MGDKDTDKLFGNSELLICGPDGEIKPIGKVLKCQMNFEPDSETIVRLPTRADFSFSCEMPDWSDWFKEHPEIQAVRKAQKMLDKLQDYHSLWHKYYGMGMRKERRKIERDFHTLALNFSLYCRMYGIMIEIKR